MEKSVFRVCWFLPGRPHEGTKLEPRISTRETGVRNPWETIINHDFFPLTRASFLFFFLQVVRTSTGEILTSFKSQEEKKELCTAQNLPFESKGSFYPFEWGTSQQNIWFLSWTRQFGTNTAPFFSVFSMNDIALILIVYHHILLHLYLLH